MRRSTTSVLGLALASISIAVQAEPPRTHVIIHRQALEGAPENTWAALKQAVLWGADESVTLEIDLHGTKDGRIIVFHDPWFDGKSDEVLGPTVDWLWEEINDVDFGSWYDRRFKDERMPLFEDVLEFCKLNKVRLTLDIKETVTPEMVRAVLQKHDAERVVYWAWVGGFGRLVGRQWQWKIMEFDGDREQIRRDVKQWLSETIWVDDPRVLLDILHREVRSREVKMPPLSLDYRPEELDFATLVQQVHAGGDQGRIAAARLRKHFQDRASATFTRIVADDRASAEAKAIAARALGRMAGTLRGTPDGTKAADALKAALTDRHAELPAAAAYALGELKDQRAVTGLIEMLRDRQQSAKVRVAAARALGRIGAASATQPLMEVAKEERDKAVSETIPQFAKRPPVPATTRTAMHELYGSLPHVLEACYWALGEIGSEEALVFLLAQHRAQQLTERNGLLETVFARRPALAAAAKTGDTRALAAAKAFAWDPPWDTYVDYVLLTRNFPAQQVVPVLLEFLGHPKTFQRQKAFYALLRVGEPAVVPLVGLLNDKQASPLAREWAAWTLGWMNDHRAVAPLMNALNDRAAGVRAKAAWSMGKMRVKQSADRLGELTKDTDAMVRDYAAESLERLGSPSAEATPPKAQFLTRGGNQLFLGDKRFRAVGANGVDLFLGLLGIRGDQQTPQWAEEALAEAGRRDIPFVRVRAPPATRNAPC